MRFCNAVFSLYSLSCLMLEVSTLCYKWLQKVNKKWQIFIKIRSRMRKAFMYQLSGLGGTQSCKDQRQKISLYCPFKIISTKILYKNGVLQIFVKNSFCWLKLINWINRIKLVNSFLLLQFTFPTHTLLLQWQRQVLQ
jgi:hypothetical protein